LKGEYLPAARRYINLYPVHVIGNVNLGNSLGLNPRVVFQSLTGGVLKRLVKTEIIRVAMNIDNRLTERNHLFTQSEEEVLEANRLTVLLIKGFWITCL
jgi:hypothetical protein